MQQDLNGNIIRRLDGPDGEGRWYEGINEKGERVWCYPSVTTILGEVYPTGEYLEKYMRDMGTFGRIEFEKAGDQGTEVHIAIDRLLRGEAVTSEGMAPKVLKCVQAWINWYNDTKPKVIQSEIMVVDHKRRVAGTIDLVAEIDGELFIIDYKTSSSLHDKHRVQVGEYAQAYGKPCKAALLHLGNRTKAKWSFSEFDVPKFAAQFDHFRLSFDMMYPDAKPDETKYPDVFLLPDAPLKSNA